jgi:acylphosphatase
LTETLSLLLRALEHAGLDLDAEAALDAVWLGLRLHERAVAHEAPAAAGATTTSSPRLNRDTGEPEATEILDDGGKRRDRPKEWFGGAVADIPSATARSLTLPRAAALPQGRDLIKSLRPLRRRVAVPGVGALDLEATVRRAAEESLLIPSFKPERERWLDVLLVIDHGLSMIIWKDTIDEFERVLRGSGAFRSVRSWWLDSDTPTIEVAVRGRGQRPSTPEELARLVRGTSRSVVLVVSDCVGARWHDGKVPRLLARWAGTVPVALMQVTPEWFWARTALGETVGSRLRSTVPAAVNQHLSWDSAALGGSARTRERERQLFRIPAATLTADAVARVAKLVAGAGAWTAGVVFDLTWEGDGDATTSTVSSGPERVARFHALASQNAIRLAAAYAASPVKTLGVLRLLRRDLLAETSPFCEAEVLLGGIVRVRRQDARWDLGASLPLEFHDGVRPLLLDGALASDVVRVLTHAASVAATRIGPTFTSWLEKPAEGAAQLDPTESEFAAAAADALLRLGGAYARIVRRDRADAREGTDRVPGSSARSPDTTAMVDEPATPDDATVSMEFLLSGRVAGVGFRSFVQRVGGELGISGTAENLPDGRIRVHATGPRRRLAELEARLRKGPAAAKVEAVTSRVISPDTTPTPPAPETPVSPRVDRIRLWELSFDEDGGIQGAGAASIGLALHTAGVTDLIVLVHGWNIDRPQGRSVYRGFVDTIGDVRDSRAPVALGALGVLWPSKLWADDDEANPEDPYYRIQSIDRAQQIEDARRVVQSNPDDAEALARLDDLLGTRVPAPELPSRSERRDIPEENAGFLSSVWHSAKNVLRTTTFYQMRNRAGVIGDKGLGPFLGQFALGEPDVRIHLVAHSVGARVAARAVKAMLEDYGTVPPSIRSLTLLQGTLSQHAFAQKGGEGMSGPGALAEAVRRIHGPVVITFSRDDSVAKTAYPLAMRLLGRDDDAPGESGPRHPLALDGARGVSARYLKLHNVGAAYSFEPRQFYNVDVSHVVQSHSGVFGPEMAWLVLSAVAGESEYESENERERESESESEE